MHLTTLKTLLMQIQQMETKTCRAAILAIVTFCLQKGNTNERNLQYFTFCHSKQNQIAHGHGYIQDCFVTSDNLQEDS